MLLLYRPLPFQEALGVLTADGIDVADLPTEPHTIALVRALQQLRAKCGGDELGTLRQALDQVCNSEERSCDVHMTQPPAAPPTCHRLPVLSVQGSVNLVKEIEGTWVALLDGKDEGQCYQCLLPSRELLQ